MPPRCRRDSAAVPPRCRRDFSAIPPRCRRDSAAISPRCRRGSPRILIFFSILKFIACSVISTQRSRTPQFSSGSIRNHHGSVSIGSIQFKIDQKSSRIAIDRLNSVRDRSKIITDHACEQYSTIFVHFGGA